MNWTNHNWTTVQCQIDFCSVGFCSVINCLDGTSSVFNWPFSQLCFCSIVICSIIHLFNLLIALLSIVEWFIVQLARFSVDFLFNCVLFNWLLFSWIFVESFCSIHLVQWVVGEVTWKDPVRPFIVGVHGVSDDHLGHLGHLTHLQYVAGKPEISIYAAASWGIIMNLRYVGGSMRIFIIDKRRHLDLATGSWATGAGTRKIRTPVCGQGLMETEAEKKSWPVLTNIWVICLKLISCDAKDLHNHLQKEFLKNSNYSLS